VESTSFEHAVAPHYPALLQRLTVVLRDPHDAEDVAQEAYLRAFRAWHRFDGTDARAWLYTIGLRLAFNELRRRRVRLFVRRARDDAWEPPVEPDLWAAIGRLSPQQRAALVLHVVDGYTQAEVASMLRSEPGTVASLISRAKAHVRKELEG
jgi:RNA polymerase sigma-70 factor (ECF subfamily)